MIALIIDLKKKIKSLLKDGFGRVRIDLVQLRVDLLKDIHSRFDEIMNRLVIIERKEDVLMSQVAQDFESLRVAIDVATNAVATKIEQLNGKISNSMTNEQVANLKAGFQVVADRLHSLAADPEDPVPEQPDDPVPADPTSNDPVV